MGTLRTYLASSPISSVSSSSNKMARFTASYIALLVLGMAWRWRKPTPPTPPPPPPPRPHRGHHGPHHQLHRRLQQLHLRAHRVPHPRRQRCVHLRPYGPDGDHL